MNVRYMLTFAPPVLRTAIAIFIQFCTDNNPEGEVVERFISEFSVPIWASIRSNCCVLQSSLQFPLLTLLAEQFNAMVPFGPARPAALYTSPRF